MGLKHRTPQAIDELLDREWYSHVSRVAAYVPALETIMRPIYQLDVRLIPHGKIQFSVRQGATHVDDIAVSSLSNPSRAALDVAYWLRLNNYAERDGWRYPWEWQKKIS